VPLLHLVMHKYTNAFSFFKALHFRSNSISFPPINMMQLNAAQTE